MLARLLAVALLLTVCVHLAGDVLEPLLELDYDAPLAFDAASGGSDGTHCEATEPCCADASISAAPALAPARVANYAALGRLRPAAADPLPQDFFRPPLSPRLS
jgi:hypothetical protein